MDLRYEHEDEFDREGRNVGFRHHNTHFFTRHALPFLQDGEIKNHSIRVFLIFFLNNEKKCTEALELEDLRCRTTGRPNLLAPL